MTTQLDQPAATAGHIAQLLLMGWGAFIYVRYEVRNPVFDRAGKPAKLWIRLLPFLIYCGSMMFIALSVAAMIFLGDRDFAMFLLMIGTSLLVIATAYGVGRRVFSIRKKGRLRSRRR